MPTKHVDKGTQSTVFDNAGAKFDAVSTSQASFSKPVSGKPATPKKPAQSSAVVKEDRTFQSEAASHFVSHSDATRQARSKPAAATKLQEYHPSAPFDAVSTSQSTFKAPVNAKPATPKKPRQDTVSDAKDTRDFSTEASSKFGNSKAPARSAPAPNLNHQSNPALTFDNAKFDAVTTQQASFTGAKDARPAEPFKPKQASAQVKEDRDFQTEAALRFVSHSRAAKSQAAQQQQQQQQQAKAAQPSQPIFTKAEEKDTSQYTSTAQNEYKNWGRVKPATPKKPHANTEAVSEDRSFRTEKQDQFTSKDVHPVHRVHGRAQSHASGAKFEGTSLSRDEYKKWDGARPAQSLKPKQAAQTEDEARDFTTESRANFAKKDTQERTRSFAPQTQAIEPIKFEAVSTAQASFQGHKFEKPRAPFKPAANSSAPFSQDAAASSKDFVSESHSQFAGTKAAPVATTRGRPMGGLRNNRFRD